MTNSVGRPLKFKTPELMQSAIDDYFVTDAFMGEGENQVYAPTVSGLAFHLGMSTEAFRNYEEKDKFLATVKRAKQRIELAIEQRLFGNNVTGCIFNLKNNFGWKDKTEQDINANIETKDTSAVDAIEQLIKSKLKSD